MQLGSVPFCRGGNNNNIDIQIDETAAGLTVRRSLSHAGFVERTVKAAYTCTSSFQRLSKLMSNCIHDYCTFSRKSRLSCISIRKWRALHVDGWMDGAQTDRRNSRPRRDMGNASYLVSDRLGNMYVCMYGYVDAFAA